VPESPRKILPAKSYDLAGTVTSGQAFRWKACGDAWVGVIGRNAVLLRQAPCGIDATWLGGSPDWEALKSYFQTEVDIDAVTATFPEDGPMKAAVEACRGLRLLRQDPWECLASFILSSTKQIVQIQQIVKAICECYGERIEVGSPHPGPLPIGWGEGEDIRRELFSFPSAERIAGLTEGELRCCKMGFRAPYLLGTARIVAEGKLDLESLRGMSTGEARERLCELPGVGEKIANCVLLFAYGFQDAFPVDVWVQRAMKELYFPKRRPTEKRLRKFIETHFGPNAGYAQQYLFHYMRVRRDGRGGRLQIGGTAD
jgi:N-glycosylase/DNA lyase